LSNADYIPQETMFWRRRVWDRIGPIDESLHYAMDWDFILRAQAAGFKFARLPRFLACFRIHDAQKTASTYAVGVREMGILRRRVLGFDPTQMQIRRAIAPYLAIAAGLSLRLQARDTEILNDNADRVPSASITDA
jgi:hypothetical protein